MEIMNKGRMRTSVRSLGMRRGKHIRSVAGKDPFLEFGSVYEEARRLYATDWIEDYVDGFCEGWNKLDRALGGLND